MPPIEYLKPWLLRNFVKFLNNHGSCCGIYSRPKKRLGLFRRILTLIICTALMALMSGLNIYDCLTSDYMSSFVGYINNYWPLIFLGASFGKAMQLGGGAENQAKLLTSRFGTKYVVPVLRFTTLRACQRSSVNSYVICRTSLFLPFLQLFSPRI